MTALRTRHAQVPAVNDEGVAAHIRPEVEGKGGLEERVKKEAAAPDCMVFKNRDPKWNAESQMYMS